MKRWIMVLSVLAFSSFAKPIFAQNQRVLEKCDIRVVIYDKDDGADATVLIRGVALAEGLQDGSNLVSDTKSIGMYCKVNLGISVHGRANRDDLSIHLERFGPLKPPTSDDAAHSLFVRLNKEMVSALQTRFPHRILAIDRAP